MPLVPRLEPADCFQLQSQGQLCHKDIVAIEVILFNKSFIAQPSRCILRIEIPCNDNLKGPHPSTIRLLPQEIVRACLVRS